MFDAMQERRWQEEDEYETAEEVRQQQEKDEYEESLRVLGMSEEEANALFAESNHQIDEAIKRYRANLEVAVGYTMSPNDMNLEQFYPDVSIPMHAWFSLLNEIEEQHRQERNNLDVDFAGEEFDLPSINWSEDEEQEEKEEEEEEEEGPMCQPIFTAPIPLGECPICMDALEMVDFTVTKCRHSFHASCLLRSAEDSSDCPMCRKQLTKKRERTNYDDIEWVEYEGDEEDEEATEYDEEGDDDEDEEEERGRIPDVWQDDEPHWDAPLMTAEDLAQRKKKDEEFTTFAATFIGRTSHSIYIQAQDTYGEAHVCFTKSHAFRAAGDSWNAHKYQCRFAELIQKGHGLLSLTEKRRRPNEANDKAIWQTNRKTHTYISPAASSKDFLASILGPSKKPVESILEIDLD